MFATTIASNIWSMASGTVRALSRAGLCQSTRLDARVVSVGNIQVGGAGKTPLVARIANEAHGYGFKVCILCRGYLGQWETQGGVICPSDQDIRAIECGDEAALLHDLAPHAYIGVGANRVQQFQAVLEKAKTKMDLVILDDGFQHWKIHKDLEIVALTSAKASEVPFRDHWKALQYADLIVWTKGEEYPQCLAHPMIRHKPLARVKYRLPSPSTQDPIWLITGVADSESVYRIVQESGYSVVKHLPFQDHAKYDRAWVEDTLKQAAVGRCKVAVTGKDWVKWKDLGVSISNVLVLEPDLVFLLGQENWSRILWEKSSSLS